MQQQFQQSSSWQFSDIRATAGSARRSVAAAFVVALALASGLSGCVVGAESELDDAEVNAASEEQAVTGSNPLVDVEYRGEVVPRDAAASVTFTDIAAGPWIYLARSDGKIEVHSDTVGVPYLQYANSGRVTAQHISWVQTGSGWDLIGSDNTTRKIRRQINNTISVMGDYPGGINSIGGIAATPSSTNKLKIYVLHGDANNVLPVLRVGEYTMGGSINWESTTRSWSMYANGFSFSPGSKNALYSVFSYMKTYVSWTYTADFTSSYEKGLAPYTEHAYHHPEGADDRFSPIGMDYKLLNGSLADGYFYGIDRYSNAGRQAYVVARLKKSNLKP